LIPSKKARLEAFETLREVAKQREGLFFEDPSTSRASVEANVYAVRVRLDVEASPLPLTSVRARMYIPSGLLFRVFREGFAATLVKTLGGQDVTLGGKTGFDEHFVTRTTTPEATRFAWTEAGKAAMLRYCDDGTASCDGLTVELQVPALLQTLEAIDAALDLVGDIASVDLFGMPVLTGLAGAQLRVPRGPWDERSLPSVLLESAFGVELGPVVTRNGLDVVTAVWASGAPAVKPPLSVHVDDSGRVDQDFGRLPAVTRDLLRQVGAATVRATESSAELRWTRIETDPGRLHRGAQLVASLVASHCGPFR